MRIVVFGSLNLDTTLDVPRRPDWGETILATGSSVAAGGKGANQAVAASRLGTGQVVMVGRTGDDAGGAFLRARLAADRVRDRTTLDPSRPTGTAFILRTDSGENAIVVAAGANGSVVPGDLDRVEDPAAPSLLVLQLEVPVESVLSAAREARRRGWLVLLNTAPARPIADELLSLLDVLVANEVEAAQLTGSPVSDVATAIEAAGVLSRLGPPHVAVTLGAQGAVLVHDRRAWHAPAPRVRVVDTTAAGDTFVGGLSVAMAEGMPEPRALAFAVAAGSLATTLPGAQPSIPARTDALALAATVAVEGIGPHGLHVQSVTAPL